jgi:kynurenine formamidase
MVRGRLGPARRRGLRSSPRRRDRDPAAHHPRRADRRRRHRGVDALRAHEAIGADELRAALERQGLELRRGDVAIVRTGYLSRWPDADFIAAHEQSGIDRDAALWLAEQGVVAVGGDTEALEVLPSTVPGNPHPVHIALLVERGIFIIEMVNCEELARDRVYEFCFVCLPLGIRGATGSMVRSVALC